MSNLGCAGPGPHTPSSGVLGTTTVTPPPAVWCGPCAAAQAQASAAAAPQLALRDRNAATLRARADVALVDTATFLALPTVTNAQTLAQVRLLSRAVAALIRLTLDRLDATD